MENNKIINIHQSFWGEVNHGHGLIASSLNDDALTQTLSSFTDRPGSTYGRSIQPYYSGKKIGHYFVFTKSYPDDTSSRAGMIFTHALIFNLKEITNIRNIDFAFGLFSDTMPEKPSKNEFISPIQKEVCDYTDNQTMYPKYIQTTAQTILKGKLPVVFSGETTNFIQLITQIWKCNFPAIRENITFQIGFAPNDISQNFIFVPSEFLDKWINHEIIRDDDSNPVFIENEVEQLLVGSSASNGFYSFIEDLDAFPESFRTISICYRAYCLYNKVDLCSSSEALQLVRSIAAISPQTNESYVKTKAIDRLCSLLSTSSEDEIKGLRNIDFSTFSGGLKKIVSSIEEFLDNQLQSSNPILNQQISLFLLEVFKEQENVIWWHDVIKSKLALILKDISDYSIIWNLINNENHLFPYFEIGIPSFYEKEVQLLKTYPHNANIELAKELIEFAKNRKWYRLYATINSDNNTLQKALLEQISLEKYIDLNDGHSGLTIILDKLSNEDFIKIALQEDNEKLNHIASDKCYNHPSLLNSLDVRIAAWRNIWIYTLNKTNDLTFGLSNLQLTVNAIFDLLLKGTAIDELIMDKISKSLYANIKDYPQKVNLWDKIPAKYQSEFVLKTANAIIESILKGNDENIETILEIKIVSHDYMDAICSRNSLKSVLLIYDKFPNLDEKYLLSAINSSPDNLDKLVSDKLGAFVRQKGWQKSADAIFDKAKTKSSFQIALNQCSYLIPKWRKFWYSNLFSDTFSEEDYYNSLCELAIELFEKGPEDNDIWKRAGGDGSILTNNANRKEQWYNAIQKLRKGGAGKGITAYSLLEKMKEDYPYRYYTEMNKLMEYFKKK